MSDRASGSSERTVNSVWRLLLRLAAIAALVYTFYLLRSVITTIVVAAMIAYVLDPMVEWLSRRPRFISIHSSVIYAFSGIRDGRRAPRHMLRTFATIYVFIVTCFVVYEGTKLVAQPFVTEIRGLIKVDAVTHKSVAQLNIEDVLRQWNDRVPDAFKSEKLLSRNQVSAMLDTIKTPAGAYGLQVLGSLKGIVEVVLLPVLAFYFLVDGRKLRHEFVVLLPRRYIRETSRMLVEFNHIMREFVVGQFILCVLAGVVVGTGLAALGVKYPLMLGVLAGITRAIPIIGPIVGGIPILILTLVTTHSFATTLLVLGFFTLLHLVESKFIMPMLIGDRMKLHPVIIILVLLVGGEIGGLVISGELGALLGMFFAAPVASLARVMIRRYWLHLPHRGLRAPLRSSMPVAAASVADTAA